MVIAIVLVEFTPTRWSLTDPAGLVQPAVEKLLFLSAVMLHLSQILDQNFFLPGGGVSLHRVQDEAKMRLVSNAMKP